MLRALERVATGEIDRLMVFMPPGYAKSLYCSVLFPAWMLAQAQNFNIVGASHGSSLAEDLSALTQSYIRRYPEILGYSLLNQSVENWRTSNGGVYRAVGVGGSVTGRRSNLTIIDDPIKGAQDAESQTVRDGVWNWYQAEIYTRKKALTRNRIILIQTRWHPDDLAGRLLELEAAGGDHWDVLRLPALCDSPNDPLGRAIGEALWPENESAEELARIRINVSEYVFGALYQQDPRPRGASFFDLDSLLIEPEFVQTGALAVRVPAPMPDKCDTVFVTVDTAIKTGQEHNSTGAIWWSYNAYTKPSTYILDWDVIQIEGAAQSAWLPSLYERGEYLARVCGARRGFAGAIIEDKATGSVLIQQSENLRKLGKYAPAYPIDSVLTAMGKEERAIAAAPYVVAEDVKITEPAFNKTSLLKGRSANHLTTQVTDFRLGSKAKDGLDLLDCFCYGVLMTHGTASGDRKGI